MSVEPKSVDVVLELQQRGQQALFGDATRPDILKAAGVDSAAYLVVTIPHTEVSLRIIQTAREAASRQGGTVAAAIDAGRKAYQEEKRKTEMSGRIEAPNFGDKNN